MEMRDPNTPHSTNFACAVRKNQNENTAVPQTHLGYRFPDRRAGRSNTGAAERTDNATSCAEVDAPGETAPAPNNMERQSATPLPLASAVLLQNLHGLAACWDVHVDRTNSHAQFRAVHTAR